jgi:hypothetical protein
MKNSKFISVSLTFILLLFIALTATVFVSLSVMEETALAGNWEEVCCGIKCTGGIDYCIGNGNYTCCKKPPDPPILQ